MADVKKDGGPTDASGQGNFFTLKRMFVKDNWLQLSIHCNHEKHINVTDEIIMYK